MGRISREVMFMQMARIASLRSTCFRLNVGAIVTQGNNPIAVGWNGQEPGAPHCAGNACPGIVPGNCGTLHAEVNALTKAGQVLINADNHAVDLYCTDSPCPFCVNHIRVGTSLTVRRVFYEKPYRDMSALDQLKIPDHDECFPGVEGVYLVTPAGYIVDHFTRQVVEMP
jgi:dCMP deaminase